MQSLRLTAGIVGNTTAQRTHTYILHHSTSDKPITILCQIKEPEVFYFELRLSARKPTY